MKRWPVIRHIRWAWHSYRFCRWWEQVGSHYWLVVNDNDIKTLNKIWRGEA